MNRGEMEKPPSENHRGWKRKVTVFTSKGTEVVNVAVWETPDGRPIEVFIHASKGGSQTDLFVRAIGKDVSRLLQAGVSVSTLVDKMEKEIGPLAGPTDKWGDVTGIQDLLAKILHRRYIEGRVP